MALVPRDDLLPQPRPTAQMIHSTTRQPTKIEHASCLDCCLTFGGRTHHTLGLRRTSRHCPGANMLSLSCDRRRDDEILQHAHYLHQITVGRE